MSRDVHFWQSNSSFYSAGLFLRRSDPSGLVFQDTTAISDLKNLKWGQKITKYPELDGIFGFTMEVVQTLKGHKDDAPIPGTQSWQTNLTESVVLVFDKEGGKCHWMKTESWDDTHILDVMNINKLPKEIPDTVGLNFDENKRGREREVLPEDIAFIQTISKKKLGLRPFKLNTDQNDLGTTEIVFTEDKLRSGSYVPSIEQWNTALKMQAPILEVDWIYLYLNRELCGKCSDADLEIVKEMFNAHWDRLGGEESTPESLEYLKYGDLYEEKFPRATKR